MQIVFLKWASNWCCILNTIALEKTVLSGTHSFRKSEILSSQMSTSTNSLKLKIDISTYGVALQKICNMFLHTWSNDDLIVLVEYNQTRNTAKVYQLFIAYIKKLLHFIVLS